MGSILAGCRVPTAAVCFDLAAHARHIQAPSSPVGCRFPVQPRPAAMGLVDLFGDVLLTKDGEKPTTEVLSGKRAVAVYFSAHWCPPCRGFTPQLAEWYTADLKDKGLEVIFVSSDREDAAFNDYYGEMPWVALPYSLRDKKNSLSKKFKVQGIPSLVILDSDGATITTDGREAVSNDPKGANFPWIPPTAAEKAEQTKEILGSDLVGQADGKYVALYFSAHWCGPCRGFTPKLAEWYNGGLKDKMEVIFVSSDRDESAFNEYFADMPWKALPYGNREGKNKLSSMFGVSGIPSLIILNSDFTVLTENGRECVGKDPTGETLPDGWLPQPFNDVNDDPSSLNEERCVIALGSEPCGAAVAEVARVYHERAGKVIDAMPYRFYTAPAGGVTSQLRKLMQIETDAKLVILDIPDDGGFYVCDNVPDTAAGVQAFIDALEAGSLTRQQLQK